MTGEGMESRRLTPGQNEASSSPRKYFLSGINIFSLLVFCVRSDSCPIWDSAVSPRRCEEFNLATRSVSISAGRDYMARNTFSLLTDAIFLAVAVVHALRLALKWQVNIASWVVPMWLSAVAPMSDAVTIPLPRSPAPSIVERSRPL